MTSLEHIAIAAEQQHRSLRTGFSAVAEALEPKPDYSEPHPLDRYLAVFQAGKVTPREMFGRLTAACMTAQRRGMSKHDVDMWLQDTWEGVRVLTQNNKRGTGLAKLRALPKILDRAWRQAERNINRGDDLMTDDQLTPLRGALADRPELLRVLDDMIGQQRAYRRGRFVYAVRQAAERLGLSIGEVSKRLKAIREAGLAGYVRGTHYDTERFPGKQARASIYWFEVIELQIPRKHRTYGVTPHQYARSKPTTPLTVLKALNGAFGSPLTYADVVGQGYDIKEWRSWLRHLRRKLDKLFHAHRDSYLRDNHWPDIVSQTFSDLAAAEHDTEGCRANKLFEDEQRRRAQNWLSGRVDSGRLPAWSR